MTVQRTANGPTLTKRY